jgi:hypothetical protein
VEIFLIIEIIKKKIFNLNHEATPREAAWADKRPTDQAGIEYPNA